MKKTIYISPRKFPLFHERAKTLNDGTLSEWISRMCEDALLQAEGKVSLDDLKRSVDELKMMIQSGSFLIDEKPAATNENPRLSDALSKLGF